MVVPKAGPGPPGQGLHADDRPRQLVRRVEDAGLNLKACRHVSHKSPVGLPGSRKTGLADYNRRSEPCEGRRHRNIRPFA